MPITPRYQVPGGKFDPVTGQRLKEEGIAEAKEHSQSWVDVMKAWLIEFAQKNDGYACADDAREYSERHHFYPESPAAWGSLFRSKVWVFIEWTQSRYTTNHRRPIRRWRLRSFCQEDS